MRSNYKKLGDFIRQVNNRNNALSVSTLLGVSIQKCFMPSIANTIGTDMSTYKIIKNKQFAYGPVTSRNGDKISIALLEKEEEAILSQAYTVFEIIDHNVLDPEYLMMWFRRPEFDRYARFKSHGSAREVFDWFELCETELPIPSIEKQREIVREYNTIVNRIALNEQLIQRLEETAQAIYKRWFVEFEFPFDFAQDKPDENGKPYKSSDGKMVWCEELEKEIPEGWEVKALGDFIESYSKKHDFKKEELIFFNTSDILNGEFLHSNYMKVSEMPGQAKKRIAKGDILYSEIRPANKRFALVRFDSGDYVVSTKLMVLRPKSNLFSSRRIYHYITRQEFIDELQFSAEGRSGTFPQITFELDIEGKLFLIGSEVIENRFENFLKGYYEQYFARKDENKILTEIKEIILSKMTKVEETTEKEMI
jgi:type I restriction enzyme S subunit